VSERRLRKQKQQRSKQTSQPHNQTTHMSLSAYWGEIDFSSKKKSELVLCIMTIEEEQSTETWSKVLPHSKEWNQSIIIQLYKLQIHQMLKKFKSSIPVLKKIQLTLFFLFDFLQRSTLVFSLGCSLFVRRRECGRVRGQQKSNPFSSHCFCTKPAGNISLWEPSET
jgi:hypothetical protein